MADGDRSQPSSYQHRVHLQHSYVPSGKGPSAGQVMVIIALLPLGGAFLGLAGITLLVTLIGLAIASPIFVIASPVLVPAAGLLALVWTGFLSSVALGLSGLSSFSWVSNHIRSKRLSSVYGTTLVQIGL